jgi:hypothetical protein
VRFYIPKDTRWKKDITDFLNTLYHHLPALPSFELPAYLKTSSPENSKSITRVPQRNAIIYGRMKVKEEQELEGVMAAFPVMKVQGQAPKHDHLPFSIFKELKQRIKENGVSSTFTKVIIEGIGGGYAMTPWDWKVLIKTVLSTV